MLFFPHLLASRFQKKQTFFPIQICSIMCWLVLLWIQYCAAWLNRRNNDEDGELPRLSVSLLLKRRRPGKCRNGWVKHLPPVELHLWLSASLVNFNYPSHTSDNIKFTLGTCQFFYLDFFFMHT